MEILYLLDDLNRIKDDLPDVYVIAVSHLSTRQIFEKTLDDIQDFKKHTEKKIYLLCDAIVSEDDLKYLESIFAKLLKLGDKILFSDFAYYQLAKENNALNQLMFYSPTLLVSKEEASTLNDLGITHAIISKECEYEGYKDILELKDMSLGMLAIGYPQIYYSKRKLLSFYKAHYQITLEKNIYWIQEKSRLFKQPILEDDKGTYIFAGKIFFPFEKIHEFAHLGMEYFLIDPLFIHSEDNLVLCLKNALEEKENIMKANHDSFIMFQEMLNLYEKN